MKRKIDLISLSLSEIAFVLMCTIGFLNFHNATSQGIYYENRCVSYENTTRINGINTTQIITGALFRIKIYPNPMFKDVENEFNFVMELNHNYGEDIKNGQNSKYYDYFHDNLKNYQLSTFYTNYFNSEKIKYDENCKVTNCSEPFVKSNSGVIESKYKHYIKIFCSRNREREDEFCKINNYYYTGNNITFTIDSDGKTDGAPADLYLFTDGNKLITKRGILGNNNQSINDCHTAYWFDLSEFNNLKFNPNLTKEQNEKNNKISTAFSKFFWNYLVNPREYGLEYTNKIQDLEKILPKPKPIKTQAVNNQPAPIK